MAENNNKMVSEGRLMLLTFSPLLARSLRVLVVTTTIHWPMLMMTARSPRE